MLGYLKPPVVKVLLAHLTRTDLDTPLPRPTREELTRDRDCAPDAMERSFHVTEILCSSLEPSLKLCATHLELIVVELFNCFQPGSNGNFHHFRRVLSHLLVKYPQETLQVIHQNGLVWTLMYWWNSAPIQDVFIQLLITDIEDAPGDQSPLPQQWILSDADVLVKHFMELIDLPPGNEQDTQVIGLFEMFDGLWTAIRPYPFAQPLVTSLMSHVDEMMPLIMNLATNDDNGFSRERRASAARLLVNVLDATEPSAVPEPKSAGARLVPNITNEALNNLRISLRPTIQSLCNCLVHGTAWNGLPRTIGHDGKPLKPPFTSFRLHLVELLAAAVEGDHASVLPKVPQALWSSLMAWFASPQSASLYHATFARLIAMVIGCDDQSVHKIVFGKAKLLSRLLDVVSMENPSHDGRGHAIMLCNRIRLRADASLDQDSYFRQLLTSSGPWAKALPRLRAESEVMATVPDTPFKVIPTLLPRQPQRTREELVQMRMQHMQTQQSPDIVLGQEAGDEEMPKVQRRRKKAGRWSTEKIEVVEKEQEQQEKIAIDEKAGIELGSDFARALGFPQSLIEIQQAEERIQEEKAAKKKSKRKRKKKEKEEEKEEEKEKEESD